MHARFANTASSYGSVSKWLHWLTALLVFAAIPLGLMASDMAARIGAPGPAPSEADLARTVLLFSLHKTVGVAIFFLALARILWALSQPKPGPLNAVKRAEAMLAETVHWLLYGSLLLVPLTGWIHHSAAGDLAPIRWPFGQSLPLVPRSQSVASVFAGLHKVFERVLVVAILLHVAGALKHHLIDRDATLRRMLPGRADAPRPAARPGRLAPFAAALTVWAVALGLGAGSGIFERPAAAIPAALPGPVRSEWQVTAGTLSLTITQLGNPVQGRFEDWTAAIGFDAAVRSGVAGSVSVQVGIASLSLGAVTSQALGPDFLDAGRFPLARFSAEITRTGDSYVATGPLTIRDRSRRIALPLELAVDDDAVTATGRITLDRRDFGIGAGVTADTMLGFGVEVTVSLRALKAAKDR